MLTVVHSKMTAKERAVYVILLISSIASEISGSYIENNYYAHHNQYVTAIEDRSSEPAGFMVMAADQNYAICSPRLAKLHWQSITVNGAQVLIVTKKNTTLITGLFNLDEHERDFIAEIRSDFMQNLAGLKLTHSTTGSLFLSSKHAYTPSSYLASGESSHAANAISLLRGASYQASTYRFMDHDDSNVDEGASGRQSGHVLVEAEEVPSRARAPELKRDRSSLVLGRAYEPYNSNVYQQQQPYGPHYSFVPATRPGYNQNYCLRRTPAPFHYYNLHKSPLAGSVCGDIYNFDLRCNILDVYSESVSVLQQAGVSVLYRDHHYFAYSRSSLPLHINRFFLVGEKVFFVYNDGSLLLKQNWLLEPVELDLVIGARRQLRASTSWKYTPPQVNSNSDRSSKNDDAGDEDESEAEDGAEAEGDSSQQGATNNGRAGENDLKTAAFVPSSSINGGGVQATKDKQ